MHKSPSKPLTIDANTDKDIHTSTELIDVEDQPMIRSSEPVDVEELDDWRCSKCRRDPSKCYPLPANPAVGPSVVTMPGESRPVRICMCGKSAIFPICDDSHADFLEPATIVMNKGKKLAFCGCGHSSNKPFCDGTHRKPPLRRSGGRILSPSKSVVELRVKLPQDGRVTGKPPIFLLDDSDSDSESEREGEEQGKGKEKVSFDERGSPITKNGGKTCLSILIALSILLLAVGLGVVLGEMDFDGQNGLIPEAKRVLSLKYERLISILSQTLSHFSTGASIDGGADAHVHGSIDGVGDSGPSWFEKIVEYLFGKQQT